MQWVFHMRDIWNLVIDSCYVQENVAGLYANEDCYTYGIIPIGKIGSVVNLNHLYYALEIAHACDFKSKQNTYIQFMELLRSPSLFLISCIIYEISMHIDTIKLARLISDNS